MAMFEKKEGCPPNSEDVCFGPREDYWTFLGTPLDNLETHFAGALLLAALGLFLLWGLEKTGKLRTSLLLRWGLVAGIFVASFMAIAYLYRPSASTEINDRAARRDVDRLAAEEEPWLHHKRLGAPARRGVVPSEPNPKAPKTTAKAPATPAPVKLLTGGNPQIPKGDGDAPVQAYIAAMPGWKRGVGERLDALIVRAVPDVRKAVKWNSPFYGSADGGWFLSLHCFTKYVKVAFFDGHLLSPLPPEAGTGKNHETRYLHIHEGDILDEEQLARWVKQASQLPGWDV